MLSKIIDVSIRNATIILLLALVVLSLGYKALTDTPVDAIPDLSDVQVIVKASYPGQSPDLVEQQVTYPLSTQLMSVPGSEKVRGFSFFGDAYIYVIFAEDTDLYWARARVQEYLNQAQANLPSDVKLQMGPDASGVGWIYQYVVRDTQQQRHLGELTRLQDWFISKELQSVAGVSEVAKVGGMVQTYQVVLDPLKLLHYQLTLSTVQKAIIAANGEVGGSVVELAEAEYMVRSRGNLSELTEFEQIPLGAINQQGTPLLLKDVATIRMGPETRRGVAEWNGEGEVVGGIVVMRDGENALDVINKVKAKMAQIQAALPDGVVLETAYDRSALIELSITYLQDKLVMEMLVVTLVCGIFLLHVRATLIIAICLPSALLIGFLLMKLFGITANLMSLGGIAIAIGALVDAAIVMVENVQKKQEVAMANQQKVGHINLVRQACSEVGPALFFSLMILTLSFLPIFALEGQEGRLFSPLAFTKTFVMAGAALLSITLVPVLIVYLLKGRVIIEDKNPVNRALKAIYRPVLKASLSRPWLVICVALAIGVSGIYPWSKLGSEFMPTFEEGDLLYMPTTLPGVSIQEAGQILQQTDRLIKTVPEVHTVFGKVGRADTATDPAPLTMIESTIQLKPKHQWRTGLTLDDIIAELDAKVNFPGLTNAWVQPIKTRIDMLSTGVKTPVGVKILADDLHSIEQAAQVIEQAIADMPETRSVIGDRPLSGRYLDITPNRFAAAKYGITVADIQMAVRNAIGGQVIDYSVQGKERFPINMRFPRNYRNDLQAIKTLPIVSASGVWLTLGQVADINISDGPSIIKSENARTIGWVFIEKSPAIALADYAALLETKLSQLSLPDKVTWQVSGQYEYVERMQASMNFVVPVTLLIIFILLHLAFHSVWQSLLVMATLPIALAGSLWFVYWMDLQFSVAMAVGMIALAGVVAEFGVVMLIYLNNSWQIQTGTAQQRIMHGAIQRVRPKAMAVLTIVIGLIPILFGVGTGSEIMQRIAAPMVGGMLISPLISMLLIPTIYKLFKR